MDKKGFLQFWTEWHILKSEIKTKLQLKTHKPFEAQRLTVRPVVLDDAPFILELMNTPKWIKFIGDRNVKTEKEAAKYIKDKAFPQLKEQGYTNNIIVRKDNGIKLGTCGLYHREGKKDPDIGFAFLPQYEG